jgi:hypothetical protein
VNTVMNLKMPQLQGISWVAQQLLVSQESIWFMEFNNNNYYYYTNHAMSLWGRMRARPEYLLTPVQRNNRNVWPFRTSGSCRDFAENNSFLSMWQFSVFLTTEFISAFRLPVLLCLSLSGTGELSMGVSYTLVRGRHRFAMKAIGHAHLILVCRIGRDVCIGTRRRFRPWDTKCVLQKF